MTKKLAQINEQIAALQKQAAEVEGVIERIKGAIGHYGLTVEDLFGTTPKGGARRKGAMATKPAAKPARKKVTRRAKAGVIRFRDEAGNAWTGNGKRPRWYLDALASGKTPEDLAVKDTGKQ